MASVSEYMIPILQAFDVLWESLDLLARKLEADAHLPTWVQVGDKQFTSSRSEAIGLYQQLEYVNEQAPRETIVLPGLMAAMPETIEQAVEVNNAKLAFKQAVLEAKSHLKQSDLPKLHLFLQSVETDRNVRVREALSRAGLSRLHLKQCYRMIPVLEAQPKKVSWTWTHTSSVRKVSQEAARQSLLKKPLDTGVRMQLDRLTKLAPGESLAVVQTLSPHCCANLVFDRLEKPRRMVKSPVPILYPYDASISTPIVVPPTTQRAQNPERQKRADRKIEEDPYLPAIRAHRYIVS